MVYPLLLLIFFASKPNLYVRITDIVGERHTVNQLFISTNIEKKYGSEGLHFILFPAAALNLYWAPESADERVRYLKTSIRSDTAIPSLITFSLE